MMFSIVDLMFLIGNMLLVFFSSTRDSWTAFKLSTYSLPAEVSGNGDLGVYDSMSSTPLSLVINPIAIFTDNILTTLSSNLFSKTKFLSTALCACFTILSIINFPPLIINISVPPFIIIEYPSSSVTLKNVLGKNSWS